MEWFFDAYEAIRDFMELGGNILTIIAWVIFLMWVLIIERLMYFRTGHCRMIAAVTERWENRSERKSWEAHRIRELLISDVYLSANYGLPLIKTLVAVCPLLGLLGTVTGMILVFDGMADVGSGNARTMASGVSQATVPTMAGMVGALSGVFAGTYLTRKADREVELLNDHLTTDH